MFCVPVFVLIWFNRHRSIVPSGKEVKGYYTKRKGRLWSSLTRNDWYKDDCKVRIGEVIRDSSDSERDVVRRRRGSGFNGKCQVIVVMSEKIVYEVLRRSKMDNGSRF